MENQIISNKLPSKRNCLSVLFYIRFTKMNVHDSAALVIQEYLIFWKKARIPTQKCDKCIEKLIKLYNNSFRDIKKNKNRSSEAQRKRRLCR